MRAEVHPHVSPSTMTSTSAATPIEAIGTLIRSTRSVVCSPLPSTSHRRPNTTAQIATGTLMRKMARQPNASTISAPTDGPAAAARPPIAPHTPMAIWRRATGKAGSSRAMPAGNCIEPPMDCRTRAPTSIGALTAMPAISEPAPKTVRPMRKMRLRPTRSASQPETSRSEATPML